MTFVEKGVNFDGGEVFLWVSTANFGQDVCVCGGGVQKQASHAECCVFHPQLIRTTRAREGSAWQCQKALPEGHADDRRELLARKRLLKQRSSGKSIRHLSGS